MEIDDTDIEPELPIHVILGASKYAKIKTNSAPRVGEPGEPIAEFTSFGWTIMSPGAETNLSSVYLTRSSSSDYEQLCSLDDVLGLEDRPAGDQQVVYSEFQEQLVRHPEGWYETGLLWKAGHPPLPNNQKGSLVRLSNLVKKLQKVPSHLDEYDKIIQDQARRRLACQFDRSATGNGDSNDDDNRRGTKHDLTPGSKQNPSQPKTKRFLVGKTIS